MPYDSQQDFSRRDLLRTVSAALVLTGGGAAVLPKALAQHVHAAIGEAKSLNGGAAYQPKSLTVHEFATLRGLADLIVPADDVSKGAADAGAAEFIDFLCSRSDELADIYTGGIAWLDDTMNRRHGSSFLDAKPEQKSALLDLIAYKRNEKPELAPGIRFFKWARNMVADAFYTSPVGYADLGYMGNTAQSEFKVPQEAIDYVLKRSPFANS